jgi:hypothetical protein
MASHVDGPKTSAADIAQRALDALEHGQSEVLADDTAKQVKAGFNATPAAYIGACSAASAAGEPLARGDRVRRTRLDAQKSGHAAANGEKKRSTLQRSTGRKSPRESRLPSPQVQDRP